MTDELKTLQAIMETKTDKTSLAIAELRAEAIKWFIHYRTRQKPTQAEKDYDLAVSREFLKFFDVTEDELKGGLT